MCMSIFTNEPLSVNEINFTQWETINGDYIQIKEAGNTYIERCIDMLAYYIQHYPKNSNAFIWKSYMKIFEQELLKRKSFVSV